MRTSTIDGTTSELTPEQGRKMFDELARAELGVSGNEFLRRLGDDDIPPNGRLTQSADWRSSYLLRGGCLVPPGGSRRGFHRPATRCSLLHRNSSCHFQPARTRQGW